MSSSALSEVHATAAEGRDDSLVVAFTAPWCGHCRAMLPDLRRAAERPAAPRFEVVDVAGAPESLAAHRISGTPTVIGLRNGVEVGRMVGRKGPAEIEAFFDALAVGTGHRRSIANTVLRLTGAGVVGFVGLMLDALPLVVFAVIVAVLSAVSEWRVRRG